MKTLHSPRLKGFWPIDHALIPIRYDEKKNEGVGEDCITKLGIIAPCLLSKLYKLLFPFERVKQTKESQRNGSS